MTTVTCIWCDHTETGEAFDPHDKILAHQIEVHGQRKMRCGCEFVPNGKRVPGAAQPEVKDWWTCEEHSPARLRQLVAWQVANSEARRWTPKSPPNPETLFSEIEVAT